MHVDSVAAVVADGHPVHEELIDAPCLDAVSALGVAGDPEVGEPDTPELGVPVFLARRVDEQDG